MVKSRSRLKRAVALSAAVATALATTGAYGAVIYTDTSTSGNWSAATWVVTNGPGNAYPQSTDAGNIAQYNTATTAASLVLDVPVTIGALQNINTGNFAITGTTNSFTIDNTGGATNPLGDTNGFIGTTSSGTLTVAPSIVIANTPLDIGTTSSGAVSITGSISGTGNLLFEDNGSGGSTVSGGINNIGTLTNAGTGTGGAAISGVIGTNVTSIIQNSSTSTLTLTGANTFTGTVQVLAGTLVLGVTSGNVGAPIGTSTTNGVITLGAGSGTAAATLKYSAGGKAATYYNAINVAAGSTGQLEIYDTSGAATFNGAVTLNNNLLLYNDNNTAGSGSYLTFTGGFTGTGNLTIGGGGSTGAGSNILLTTNAVNMNGSITYTAAPGAAVIDTISAAIGANVTGVTVNGSAKYGTLDLTGVNAYTSPTNVINGTLMLGSGGSLAGTAVTVGNTAASATTVGDLKVAGNYTIGTSGNGSLTVGGANASNTSTAGVNGILSMVDASFNTLSINNATAGATALTLGGATTPTTLNMEFGGGNADKIALGSGLVASIGAGGVVINLTNLAAGNAGTQTLISAPGGGLTSGGNITLGTITNYGGYSSITLNTTATAVTLTETGGAATPQYAYWKGTQGTVWNQFTGGSANNSNFTSDPAGTTDTHQSPGSTTNVFFTANTATNLNTTLGEPFTINSLSFTGSGTQAATSAVTIGGTFPLTINAAAGFTDSQSTPVTYNAGTGIVVEPGSIGHTISAPVVLGASQTWEIDNSASTPLVVSGLITGTGMMITKTGVGSLNLTNGANTFSGGITINAGTINSTTSGGGKSSLGTGSVTVNAGATLNALQADAFGYNGGGPGTLYINGGSVTDVNGTSSFRVTLTNLNFTGGSLVASAANGGDVSGNYSLGGGSIVTNASPTTATITGGKVSLQATTSTFNIASGTTPSGVDLSISSNLINYSGTSTNAFVKSGAGYLLLSGANTYTGNTSVTAGTLAVSGTMGATLITTSGTGTLALLSPGAITASTLTLGGGTLALRSDSNASFTTANSNTINLTGNSTINVDQLTSAGANTTLSLGTISDPNSSGYTITITGGHGDSLALGALKLPTTTGGTTILTANANTTITGGVTNGELTGFATTNYDTLSLGGTGTQNAILGTIADSTAGSRTLGAYTPVTVTGATWTLAGTNTYSGNTTISGGTLIAANTQALGSNAYAANGEILSMSGGTLDLAIDSSIKPYNTTVSGVATIVSDKATASSAGITHTLGTLGIGSTTLNITAGPNVSGGSPAIAFGATTLTATATGTTTLVPTSANLMLTSVTSSAAAAATDTLTLDGTSSGNTITGSITNSAAGTTAITKNNTSTWTFSGASAYTGATTVNGGTLALTSTASLAKTAATINNAATLAALAGSGTITSAGSLTLNSGSVFTMVDGSTGTFNLSGTGTGTGLTVNTGSLFSLELSSDTGLSDTVSVAGPVTIGSGGGRISLVGLGTSAPSSSTVYTLISAPSGGLNTGGGFALTNRAIMFGGNPYTATLTDTSTAVTVTFNPATGLAVAYWTGNQAGTWSTTGVTAAGATNWSSDPAGQNDAGQQPTSVTDVYFTASGANNLSSTVDAPYDINSLNFNSSPGGPVVINGSGTSNTLSLEAGGLTVQNGAPAVTVNAPLVLKASQTFTNNSGSVLTVGGTISEGTSRLITAGSGSMNFSNQITGSGGFTASGSGIVALGGSNNFTGGVAINSGTVQLASSTALGATANAVTITAGGTLDLNGQTIAQTLAITGTGVGGNGALINSNTTTAGSFSTNLANNGGFTVGGPGAITISGQLLSQTLTKIGSGTLTVAGTADNASGGITVNGGLVILAKASTSGIHATSGLTVNTGGTAQLGGTGGDQLYDGGALNVNGGTLDLNGRNETVAGFAGTLATGLITNTSSTAAVLTVGNGTAGGTYAGALQNGTGTVGLSKIGTGTETLSGTNTYGGATTISAGVISIAAPGALSPNTAVTGTSTGQLGIVASGTYSTPLSLTGDYGVANFDPAANAGALRFNLNSGTFTMTGAIGLATTAAANTEISAYSTGSTVTLAGAITGGSSTGTFYLGGGGAATTHLQTFVLSNAGNTYAGNTTLLGRAAGATLQLSGGDNRLPTTTSLTLEGDYYSSTALRSWLDLNGTNQTLAGLISATTSLTTAATPGDNRVGNSSTTLSTLTLAPAGANTFGGILGGGPGNNFGLTMAGAGTLSLTSSNTYTGPTSINLGTLLASNTTGSATGTGTITIGSNGVLAGGGFVSGPVNVNGTISAGSGATTSSTTGKLTTTGLQTWNNGGAYAWKLNTNNSTAGSTNTLNGSTLYTDTSGANWDQLAVSSLTVAASSPANFTIQVIGVAGGSGSGSTFAQSQSYQWIAATVPAASLAGNFAGAFNVATSGFGGYTNLGSFSAAYQLDPGNSAMEDLVVDYNPAPEPTSLALVGIVAGAITLRRRRRPIPA